MPEIAVIGLACEFPGASTPQESWENCLAARRAFRRLFEQADPGHWLALDVAARALTDAGLEGGEGLPRARAGVVLGNSLTGSLVALTGYVTAGPACGR
jgi:enediyne polyketide synthase